MSEPQTQEYKPNDFGVPAEADELEAFLGQKVAEAAQDDAGPNGDGRTEEAGAGGDGPQGQADAGGKDGGRSADRPDADASPSDTPADGTGGRDRPDALEAPAHWDIQAREMFAKQTLEAQKWLLDRSNAMEAAHTQRSQEIAPWRDTVQRWSPYLSSIGMTPEHAINTLLATERALRTGSDHERVALLRKFVNDYGIKMPAEGETPTSFDPRVDALTRQMQEMQAGSHQQMQAAQQARVEQTTREVETFRNERGQDGKLSHPYFGEVEAEMRKLAQADINAGVQPEIKSLYDRACWSTPAVRDRLILAQTQEAQAKQAEEARKKREAGASISGAGSAGPEVPKDLETYLWDQYRKAAAA